MGNTVAEADKWTNEAKDTLQMALKRLEEDKLLNCTKN